MRRLRSLRQGLSLRRARPQSVLNPATRKMPKCDACADRLDHGLQPICVESCPQRAIEFGPIDELRKKYGDRATIAPLPDADLTKPSLVIRPPKGLEA